ncbi:COP9 signalosome complex subunit 1, partial [Monoraphidium neglectum]
MELEALKIAADELKQTLRETFNTARYEDVMTRIGGRLGPAYTLDQSLLDSTEKAAAARKERLESELHGSKSNLIKESIRLGHNDLGDFYYNRGSLSDAFKCYVRTRDYCTTPRHVLAMCLNVIRCAVEMGNFLHVANYVGKAEATPEAKDDPCTSAKLKAAAGLSLLDQRKYRQAARAFVEVSPELAYTYNEVLSPADVALYGGLCALATFDRSDLQSKVIGSIGFREFLELHPQVRDLISDFYNSRYASCLAHLAALRPALALDVHLHDHAQALYASIRHRALVQYTAPYSSVSLAAMAQAFGTDTGALEKELATLIMDGQVHARIDSQAKVLYARHADVRSATFKE